MAIQAGLVLAVRTVATHSLASDTHQGAQIVRLQVLLQVPRAARLTIWTSATQVVRVAQVQVPDPLEGLLAWQRGAERVVPAVPAAGAQLPRGRTWTGDLE